MAADPGASLAAVRTSGGGSGGSDPGGGAPLSSPTAGGARTPGSARAKGFAYAGLVYGADAVGRRVHLGVTRNGRPAWDKAEVLAFEPASGQHRIRRSTSREEEWVRLVDLRFKWSGGAPPGAPPNPTWKPECAKEAAIGKRLRVYWPAMQKWYVGSVKSYDHHTDSHIIFYKDGDTQTLRLQQEPVLWADDDASLLFGSPGPSDAAAAATPSARSRGAAEAAAAVAASFAGSSSAHPGKGGKGAPAPGAAAAAAAAAAPAPAAAAVASAPSNSHTSSGAPRGGGGALGKHGRGEGEEAAAEDSQPGKKQKRPSKGDARPAIADKHLAVGCRIGVYWNLDKAWYTGKLKSYSPQSGKFIIQYDDGQSEALLLERERFMWHSPRGSAAGYRPALHSLMQQLGAEGIRPLPQEGDDGRVIPLAPMPHSSEQPPTGGGQALVGWRVKVYWGATGDWHEAEVLSFDEARRRHHLLYLDGEEELTELAREQVVFLKATRTGAISAGRFSDTEHPRGRDAVGWHVAVYWRDDRQFYQGLVSDYEPSTGRHKVVYIDGEREWLHLRNERVIWRLPPAEDSDDEGDSEEDDSEAETGTTGSRLLSESGDDSSAEEAPMDSDDEVWTTEAEKPSAQRRKKQQQPKARRKERRRKPARSSRTRSDSNSASYGRHAGPSASDAAGDSHGDGVTGPSIAGTALARAGADQHGHHKLHLSLKGARGGGGSGGGGGGGGASAKRAPGSASGKGAGNLARQASGRGRGDGFGAGLPPLNLPPLLLRRASHSGCEAAPGSPLTAARAAESLQLAVRILPGSAPGQAPAGSGAAAAAAAAAAAPGPGAAAGPGAGGTSVAAAAGGGGGSAPASQSQNKLSLVAELLQPYILQLPAEQQRLAGLLKAKMRQLDSLLGKLGSTAGSLGWKLEPASVFARRDSVTGQQAQAAQQAQAQQQAVLQQQQQQQQAQQAAHETSGGKGGTMGVARGGARGPASPTVGAGWRLPGDHPGSPTATGATAHSSAAGGGAPAGAGAPAPGVHKIRLKGASARPSHSPLHGGMPGPAGLPAGAPVAAAGGQAAAIAAANAVAAANAAVAKPAQPPGDQAAAAARLAGAASLMQQARAAVKQEPASGGADDAAAAVAAANAAAAGASGAAASAVAPIDTS